MPESKSSEKRISAAERRRQALELRGKGMTFPQIAERIGYRSVSGAYDAVMKGLQETLQEPADELRKLEGERLDKLLSGLWAKAEEGNLWAVDRALNIMERRARLYGLDTPPSEETGRLADAFLQGVDTVKDMQAEDLSE